jgi:hypothetical protein
VGPMEIIDVIGAAGSPNASPQWAVAPGGVGDRGAWVKPAKVHGEQGVPVPGGGTPGPGPSGPVCPDPKAHEPKPKPGYPGDRIFDVVGIQLERDYARAGQLLNAQSATWFARVLWDHLNEGLTLEASIAKHRQGWCAVLGIQP